MNSSNRIIFNTGIVYAQQIVTALISLLSVRFVLQALGEEDYGVYMLVAGVVVMLNVLSNTMSNTSMRFMAYNLGKNDLEVSKQTFNTTLYIHYCLAFFIVILLEIGGWLMFDYVLNIPDERIADAKIVYQFMVVTSLVTVVSVPFDAVINSHENLLFLSIMTVIQSIATLGIAIFLLAFDGRRLVLYGLSIMILSIVIRVVKQVYTRKKYPECRVNFKKYKDKTLMKSILSFTGWDFLNSLSALCSTQLRGLLINMFFGVKLNAAEGIGKKVNSQLNVVSTGITRAITPQMNKMVGSGDRESMLNLLNIGVKYTTFMYCLVCIPIMVEMKYILNVWLKEVPAYTVIFCQMCILLQMTDKFTWQIGNALRAIGQIKQIMIVGSCLSFSSIIIGYILFNAGAGPVSVYIVELAVCFVYAGTRFYYGKKIAGLKLLTFVRQTTLPVILPIVVGITCIIPLFVFLQESFARFVIVSFIFMSVNTVLFWQFSMNMAEKEKVKTIILKLIHKM